MALGYLDILLSGPGLDKSQKKFLSKIRQEDEKLHGLVEKLIVFSLVQSPRDIVLERAEAGLAEIVDDALKSLGARGGLGPSRPLRRPAPAAGRRGQPRRERGQVQQPKLFRKFYQIDDDFTGQIPGFGLGLAFVKSVAEAHGGLAGMTSVPGGGSEFFFDLPFSAPSSGLRPPKRNTPST